MLNRICDKIDNSKVAVAVIGTGIVIGFVAMFVMGMNETHPFV